MTKPYDSTKRVLDLLGAATLLLLLWPVLVVIALLVWANMGAPVLFRQERPGKDGKLFTLYKFRTMEEGSADDEQRLTSFGQLLRSTSLDELPELFNILIGDMSFVGPRPLLPEYLPLYSESQARRHEVRPGLTGLAQVNGRNALTWSERFANDVEYVDSRSFDLDMSILLRTVAAVLSREGISSETSATMEPFRGEK
ncbi:MAG: sugar transferase [Coriobacteriia bacterium]|nr:sugar transferase [Coriobacteriia bacterium]